MVCSTWRHNASIFEPTGKIAAQNVKRYLIFLSDNNPTCLTFQPIPVL